MGYDPGLLERWAGAALRALTAYLFVVGAVIAIGSGMGLNAGGVAWGVAFMAPYLGIRYRDTDSTTIPLVEAVR